MSGRPSERVKETRESLMRVRPGATPAEVRARIAELCRQNDYDPVAALLGLLREGYKVFTGAIDDDGEREFLMVSLDPKDAISIHKEILSYIAPKLKAISIEAHIRKDVRITVVKFGEVPEDVIDAEVIDEEIENAITHAG